MDLVKALLRKFLPILILAGACNTLVVLTVKGQTALELLGGVTVGLGELTASLSGWLLLSGKVKKQNEGYFRFAVLLGIGVMGPGVAMMAHEALMARYGLLECLAMAAATVIPCGLVLVFWRRKGKSGRKAEPAADPQLDQLKALRTAGIITEEEFRERRASLSKHP